jgi:tetratricopeptide (TPR) repeat protein
VGTALEALYQERIGDVAALLATHFAGHPEKEQHYARLAGERAATQYANDEALRQLSRALALTPEGDREERFVLLLAREQVYDRQSDREAQRQDLAALEAVATALADPQKQAEVALRQANCAYFSADSEQCSTFAQEAAGLAQSLGSPELEAQAHRLWAMALGHHQGQHEAGKRHFERGLALARAAGARWLEAEILRQISWDHSLLGEHDQAEACLRAALSIFQDVGDRHDEVRIQHNLAAFSSNRFEYERAHGHWEEALRVSRELGARFHEAIMRLALTELLEVCGQYATARDHDRSVLPLTREIGARGPEILALLGLGCMSHALGESEEALPYVEEGLALAREIGERYVEAYALTALGHVLGALGQQRRARAAYEQALALRREMSQEAEATEAQAGLARLSLAEGDLAQALDSVEDILSHLESGTLEGTEQPLLVYLTCYQVLQASDDPRAHQILDEGHRLLQEIAGKITDPELHRSFLENVPAHRELVAEYARQDPSVRPG